MTNIDRVLELAKHSPLTKDLLVKHGFSLSLAKKLLKDAYDSGKLERVKFLTDSKIPQSAYRYILKKEPKKTMRQEAMDWINKISLFTSADLAKAIGVTRNSASSALNDLTHDGFVEHVVKDNKIINFRRSIKNDTSKQDKCLQELKKYVTLCLGQIEHVPWNHPQQKRALSNIRAILERAEVKDV